MIRVADCLPGKLYKRSRSEAGPAIFYAFLTPPQERRVARRLQSRAGQLRSDEAAVLRALRAGERLAVRYVRGVAGGEAFEIEQYCALPADYELRPIKRPPGFGAKRRATDDEAYGDQP